MPPRDTTTRTIRIDHDVDVGLRRLSAEQGLSVNSLVSRSLRKLVEWDIYAEKFGFVTVPGILFTRLIDLLSEEEAAELGRWAGTNIVREFITFWFKDMNLETLRKGLRELAAQYARPFEYQEDAGDHRYTIVLYHGGGPTGSVYYGEMIRVLLQEIHLDPNVERTENEVIVRFHDLEVAPALAAAGT